MNKYCATIMPALGNLLFGRRHLFCIEAKCLDYYQQGQPEYIQSCNAGTLLHLSKSEIQIKI